MEISEAVREQVVELHLKGYGPTAISKLITSARLSQQAVSYTLKRWRETGSVENRARSGAPRIARTSANRERIRQRVERNDVRSQRAIARELCISHSTVSRIVHADPSLQSGVPGASAVSGWGSFAPRGPPGILPPFQSVSSFS